MGNIFRHACDRLKFRHKGTRAETVYERVSHGMLLIRERATGNGQRATGNGQRATGNGQRATGNGQRATGNGQRATGNGQRATGNGQRATGNGQRATGNGQRATGNGQLGTGNGERTKETKREQLRKCAVLKVSFCWMCTDDCTLFLE